MFSDGPAVKGFVSVFEPPEGKPPQELKPDGGGHHKLDDFWRHDAYAVTLNGTVEVSGKLEDADGKAIKDAKITIEPAYGDAVIATTDGGGAFKVTTRAKRWRARRSDCCLMAVIWCLWKPEQTVPFRCRADSRARDFPSRWSSSSPASRPRVSSSMRMANRSPVLLRDSCSMAVNTYR